MGRVHWDNEMKAWQVFMAKLERLTAALEKIAEAKAEVDDES